MRIFMLALLSAASVCACGAEATSRAPSTAASQRAPAQAPAQAPTAPAPGTATDATTASDPAGDADRHFLVNARRAIREYRTFIEKAGDRVEYAEAVRRSHDRITDLEQMIEFVENGRREREAR